MNKVRFMKYAFAVSAVTGVIIIFLLLPGRGEKIREAVWDDDWKKAEYLLKKGVDSNDHSYQSALRDVILYENEEAFRIFAENGESVFELDNLFLAAGNGRVHVVRAFLDAGFDINQKGEMGVTALLKAASESKKSNADVVGILVENGADVNAITDYGVTPLMAAAAEYDTARQPGYYNDTEQHTAAAEEIMGLVQRKADRALLNAAVQGDSRKIKRALDNGAFINTRNRYGYAPLHLASEKNRIHAVKLLLEKGAETDSLQVNGISSLHLAVKGSGDIQVCEALIKAGAKLDTCDKGFSTPLTDTLLQNKHDLLQFLIDQGADPDFSGEYGQTPLMSAALFNDISAMDILLKAHVDLDRKDSLGRTALFYAAESSSLDALKYLVAYGGEVNSIIEDEKGPDHLSSLLMYAARWGGGPYEKKSAFIKWLVEEGADVNSVNARGRTAFIQSVDRGDIDMVSLLLELGADRSLDDNKEMKALDHALAGGHDAIVELLEERK